MGWCSEGIFGGFARSVFAVPVGGRACCELGHATGGLRLVGRLRSQLQSPKRPRFYVAAAAGTPRPLYSVFDQSVHNCCVSRVVAPVFFVVFVLVAQFVLVNVVVAVLMKHLEVPAADTA